MPNEGLQAFMAHCLKKIGEAYFRTPRNTIKAFLDMLSLLEQNHGIAWTEFLDRVEIPDDTNPDLAPLEGEDPSPTVSGGNDDLASFKL
jgi:hypothetical protein